MGADLQLVVYCRNDSSINAKHNVKSFADCELYNYCLGSGFQIPNQDHFIILHSKLKIELTSENEPFPTCFVQLLVEKIFQCLIK